MPAVLHPVVPVVLDDVPLVLGDVPEPEVLLVPDDPSDDEPVDGEPLVPLPIGPGAVGLLAPPIAPGVPGAEFDEPTPDMEFVPVLEELVPVLEVPVVEVPVVELPAVPPVVPPPLVPPVPDDDALPPDPPPEPPPPPPPPPPPCAKTMHDAVSRKVPASAATRNRCMDFSRHCDEPMPSQRDATRERSGWNQLVRVEAAQKNKRRVSP